MGHLVVTRAKSTTVKVKMGKEKRKYDAFSLTFLLPPDGDSKALSISNTDRVDEACGKQINRAINGKK